MIGLFALGSNLLAESVARAGARIPSRRGPKSRARTLMRGIKRRERETRA
jgi:peptide/nickel transport system permease protein